MKIIRKFQKELSIFILFGIFFTSCQTAFTSPNPPEQEDVKENCIKIALLLDTSGSMNGLLEQAKSQLWSIVNEMVKAKKYGQFADLEIALYQYGNSRLSETSGYIEQISPLSNDLDDLSEKLFALTTMGGEEYCGHVIRTATNDLLWDTTKNGLNLIFIAGNEPFTQGSVNYKNSCRVAMEKGITINTIFCGDSEVGIRGQWLAGAKTTEGAYMNIDMNRKTQYVETPFDDQIASLNDSLNTTYIPYGRLGTVNKTKQVNQDKNSMKYGKGNKVKRAVSKSSHLYKNKSWDLVDAKKGKDFKVSSIDNNTLPKNMQSLNEAQKLRYIDSMSMRRSSFQKQIATLNLQRVAYIDQQQTDTTANSLDKAMISAIHKQAEAKGFYFGENPMQNLMQFAEIEVPMHTAIPRIDLDCNHGHNCCQVGCSCCPDSLQTGVQIEAVFKQKAYVDFDFFEKTMKEAKEHRKTRLIDFNTFTKYSKKRKTIILDTRSKAMYDRMHIKGAIHLNFSDFSQENLARIIPSKDTRILIYCNNNFKQEPQFQEVFFTKSAPIVKPTSSTTPMQTLALNIPTYINLYGYGYKNVFELSELITSQHPQLKLEGTDIE